MTPLHRPLAFVVLLATWPLSAFADLPVAPPPASAPAPATVTPPAPATATAQVAPAPNAVARPAALLPPAAKCRPGVLPLPLRAPRAEWNLSPCRGGLQDIRLLDAQFKLEARPAVTGVASWAKDKFAAGPLDLVETWDARWDPFRDTLDEVKVANLQLAVRTPGGQPGSQTVAALAVPSLEALAQIEPTWGVVAHSATEVQFVWPDPARVRSPIYLWKRVTPAGPDKPYLLHVELAVWNVGLAPAQYRLVHEITTYQDPTTADGGGMLAMFAGPPEHKGASFSFADTAERFDAPALDTATEEHTRVGLPEWLGVDSRYFLLAMAPAQGFPPQNTSTLRHLPNGVVMARLVTAAEQLPATQGGCVPEWVAKSWGGEICPAATKAGHVKTYSYDAYSGPKDLDELKASGHNLQAAVDFGWFGLIGRPMLWVLNQAHDLTGSWPLAILLLTVLVKALLWPITAKSLKSMRGMQKIKPELDKMRAELTAKAKKLGQDKADAQEVNRITFELYKKHGVNPLGGCLPMLLQLPVYIALYRTIQSSVGLYNQPLFGWVHDLTQKDPFYVLPLVLGAVMFAQQKLTPQVGGDPAQQKMMLYFMPVLFTLMMLQLPSGLTLYILVNTALGIAQTLYTNRDSAVAKAA